jgi:hypothetical protein
MGYFRILGAIPGFFLSSLFLMLLSNVIATRLGISVDIDYVTAMLINITLWIVIAPFVAVSGKKRFFGWH